MTGAGSTPEVPQAQPAQGLLAQVVERSEQLLNLSLTYVASESTTGPASDRIDLDRMDTHQVICYDLAYLSAAVSGARHMLKYAALGEAEELLARAYTADVIVDLRSRLDGRWADFGIDTAQFEATVGAPDVEEFLADARSMETVENVIKAARETTPVGGPTHLNEDFTLMAETFRRFGESEIAPRAEEIHRHNADVPEDIIHGVAELGCFGLTIPEQYGGFATEDTDHTMAMVIATEQLTWAALAPGGALITRPEILTKALVNYGTEVQKKHWLPRIASGEIMVGVAVTEPDYGSDVANIKTKALRASDESGWYISGVKTWCTFAGRADILMLLARTGQPEDKHKGLSLFIVPKTPQPGHSFAQTQDNAAGVGAIEGRAIDTIGYRGLHSFEVSFDNWFVSDDSLVGGPDGLGKGFYMQMDAFANGRLQTAARAVGLMQAAFEKALTYSQERVVFGKPIFDYQLTKAKLARMAWLIQACRQYTYSVAALLSADDPHGQLEASMVKLFACRGAEWVTREAMQIHGGMGYAEEFDVSRYFVDARVLSIFEGAEETLALRVVIRGLLANALAQRS